MVSISGDLKSWENWKWIDFSNLVWNWARWYVHLCVNQWHWWHGPCIKSVFEYERFSKYNDPYTFCPNDGGFKLTICSFYIVVYLLFGWLTKRIRKEFQCFDSFIRMFIKFFSFRSISLSGRAFVQLFHGYCRVSMKDWSNRMLFCLHFL